MDGELLAENEMLYLRNVKPGSKLYLQREDFARLYLPCVVSCPPAYLSFRAVSYECGGCGEVNKIRRRDPIRCRNCGYRVLYKLRTGRRMYPIVMRNLFSFYWLPYSLSVFCQMTQTVYIDWSSNTHIHRVNYDAGHRLQKIFRIYSRFARAFLAGNSVILSSPQNVLEFLSESHVSYIREHTQRRPRPVEEKANGCCQRRWQTIGIVVPWSRR